MSHDWTPDTNCCRRCGITPEVMNAGFRDPTGCEPNVVGMTHRRLLQIRDEVAKRAAKMQTDLGGWTA